MNDAFQFGKNPANHLQRTYILTEHFGSKTIKQLGGKIEDFHSSRDRSIKIYYCFPEKGKELDSR